MNFERWVWTELIAFDNRLDDCGVSEYLDTLGFVPAGMCLLVSSPDFVLLHAGMECESVMPPDICSRNAHPGNEVRIRQEWTNYQIRRLVQTLTTRGCPVYVSFFTVWQQDKYHHEWLSDHQEALQVWSYHGRGSNFNVLTRLNDGTLTEDFFIPQTVKACRDYGFAGWHGPDGYGPLSSGNIMGTDVSDSMLSQIDFDLPESLKEPCGDSLESLRRRSEWIWQHRRSEWIGFNVSRWLQFWSKMTAALHRNNLKCIINSAWTKANFDALYEYGIDYLKMASLGIDYMVVETVALGLSQSHPSLKKHYDFAAALMETKAAAPDFKLIFLHGIKDVVENWDNLRHTQSAYERELYTLSGCYYADGRGLRRAADGLLGCLADGIKRGEWDYIRKCWDMSFTENPFVAGQVISIWCDEMLEEGLDDFDFDGFPPSHDQVTRLMEHGVQIQATARLEHLPESVCPFFIPSVHLLHPEQFERIMGLPAILGGRREFLEQFAERGEIICDDHYAVLILSGRMEKNVLPPSGVEYVPTTGELYFINDRNRLTVNPELWNVAAQKINLFAKERFRAAGIPFAECPDTGEKCTLNTRLLDSETLLVAVENGTPWGYITERVRISCPVESVNIISSFPLRIERMVDEYSFEIKVPPRGVAVASVKCRKLRNPAVSISEASAGSSLSFSGRSC